MQGRILFVLLIMLSVVMPAAMTSAQVETNAFYRAYADLDVLNVTLYDVDPLRLQLTVDGSQTEGCGQPILFDQWRQGHEIFIEVYSEINSQTMCQSRSVFFSETVLLEGRFEPGHYHIRVNDFPLDVTIRRGEPTRYSTDSYHDERYPVVDQLYLLQQNTAYNLLITGYSPSGCTDEPLRVDEDYDDDKLMVELWYDDSRCSGYEVPFHHTLNVEISPRLDTIEVNGYEAWFPEPYHEPDDPPPTPPMPDTVRVYHVIEDVQLIIMESYPMQLQLMVSGYQPDGCGYPVQIRQQRFGNTVEVEIYRDLPIDVMCPMSIEYYEATIPLQGGFESGRYHIRVNNYEITVDL